jgi:hypothetical protein
VGGGRGRAWGEEEEEEEEGERKKGSSLVNGCVYVCVCVFVCMCVCAVAWWPSLSYQSTSPHLPTFSFSFFCGYSFLTCVSFSCMSCGAVWHPTRTTFGTASLRCSRLAFAACFSFFCWV